MSVPVHQDIHQTTSCLDVRCQEVLIVNLINMSGICLHSHSNISHIKTHTAQQLHDRVQSSSMDVKLEALKDLAKFSRDITFAQEFINLDGIYLLTQMVESGNE